MLRNKQNMSRITYNFRDKLDAVFDVLPIIGVVIVIAALIGSIIYSVQNTSYEISYTTGEVVDKYEKEYDTTHYKYDDEGNVIERWETHHHEYYTVAQVKDTDYKTKLNQREFYEHHQIGDSVKIKVSERYFKDKYLDTTYFIVY